MVNTIFKNFPVCLFVFTCFCFKHTMHAVLGFLRKHLMTDSTDSAYMYAFNKIDLVTFHSKI